MWITLYCLSVDCWTLFWNTLCVLACKFYFFPRLAFKFCYDRSKEVLFWVRFNFTPEAWTFFEFCVPHTARPHLFRWQKRLIMSLWEPQEVCSLLLHSNCLSDLSFTSRMCCTRTRLQGNRCQQLSSLVHCPALPVLAARALLPYCLRYLFNPTRPPGSVWILSPSSETKSRQLSEEITSSPQFDSEIKFCAACCPIYKDNRIACLCVCMCMHVWVCECDSCIHL